ncbi:MAG: hypothetical protein AAGA93_05600 [Actinomycetota bacterium]
MPRTRLLQRALVLLLCLASVGLVATTAEANDKRLLNDDPGFERGLQAWETYIAPSLRGQAVIETITGPDVRFGDRSLRMRLPASAQDNQRDWIRVGQRLDLDAGREYELSAAVRWNNPGNRLPTAIVSAWCLHADGGYSGYDEFITVAEVDASAGRNGYLPIRFNFSPGRTGESLCYLALLTHQNENLDATEILVDAFRISELGARPTGVDPRTGNLLVDGDFDARSGANPGPAWSRTHWNPERVRGLGNRIVGETNPKLRLTLPENIAGELNNTWTGRYQTVSLKAGVTYELSAMIDRNGPGNGVATIVNMYAYLPPTGGNPEQWIGSIDYKFTTEARHPYDQTFTPTVDGDYQITTRVFGWGNTEPFSVTIDKLALEVVR